MGGELGFISFTGEGEADLAGEEESDCPSLDTDLDLDLFMAGDRDLDSDLLLVFLGDFELKPSNGECDLDRFLRDNERDLERLLCLTGECFLLTGERVRLLTGDLDRRRDGGVLDFVRLRGLLDLDRRLRLRTTTERDRVRLLLRFDRDRERRALGIGDLLRRDRERLLERLPPVRLAADRERERRTGRLDREWERRNLVVECDRERLATAPPRLGERVLERLVPPRAREPDLRLFLGEREREGDLRPPPFGDRDSFRFREGEIRRCLGEAEKELLLGDFFFLGVREREVERDRPPSLLGDFGDWDSDFLFDTGDRDTE